MRDWKNCCFGMICEKANEENIDDMEILEEMEFTDKEREQYKDYINFADEDLFYADLIENIEEKCVCGYNDEKDCYNDTLVACYITTFCCDNNINIDTQGWDNLVYYVWNHISKDKRNLTYTNEEDFDLSIGQYLC